MIKLTDPYGKELYVSADDVIALDTVVECSPNTRTLTRIHFDCSDNGFFCADPVDVVASAIIAYKNS